jgi:hypothetical protein
MTANKLFAAFLYGQNIPGRRYLTGPDVEQRLRTLGSKVTFAGIVSRPDSILLLCDPSLIEKLLQKSLLACLDCKSVVMEGGSLDRIVTAARAFLHTIGQPTEPPYRISTDGAEWEWCLVLWSEKLPPLVSEETCFGTFTKNVVPVQVVDYRALLARKRRRNPSGTRITLGSILNAPWEKALKERGIVPACLTSRTLNQAEKVALAARDIVQAGAKNTPSHPLGY